MMRDYVKEKVLARGKKISIGIDVHKEWGSLQFQLTTGSKVICVFFTDPGGNWGFVLQPSEGPLSERRGS